MKILHTSDWHLGHTLYNYDRTDEQADMLRQMADIVASERPDVFLLCGDVCHTSQPSAAVQAMLAEGLVSLHEAHPQMTIVVTAGNHDSGTKHEIFRTPWRALRVHAVGQLRRERTDDHIIEVPGKGYVIAVPYVNERSMPEGLFQQLLDRVGELNTQGLPVVMTAHTTVSGCDFTGHDRATDVAVGGIDALRLEQMGQGYDYLALGHIHHGQFVHSGRHNVRYSGTPLPVSFDETFDHSVSVVDIGSHGQQPSVREVAIICRCPLVTLPADGWAPWEQARQLLADFPADQPAYIRLNVEIDDFLPAEAHAEAVRLTKTKECRFCHINVRRKTVAQGEATERVLTVQEFRREDPLEIARRYAADKGIGFDADMEAMFREVARMVDEELRNE